MFSKMRWEVFNSRKLAYYMKIYNFFIKQMANTDTKTLRFRFKEAFIQLSRHIWSFIAVTRYIKSLALKQTEIKNLVFLFNSINK